jgi:hypothetical protein
MRSSFYLGAGLFLLEMLVYWHLNDGIDLGNLATFHVYLRDITLVCGFYFFFSRLGRISSRLGILVIPLMTLDLIGLISLVRGILEFGIQQAVNESRTDIGFLSALSWLCYMTVVLRPTPQAMRKLVIVGVCLVTAVELVNVIKYGIGSANDFITIEDGSVHTARPIMNVQALFLILSIPILLLTKNRDAKQKFTSLALSIFAFFAVVVSQQRSVLISGIIMVIFMLFFRKTRIFALAVTSTTAAAASIVLFGGESTSQIRATFLASASNQSTLIARSGSWAEYLDSFFNSDLLNQIIGSPYGSGWGRYDGGSGLWAEFNPHNWYIILILRFGAIGLLAMLAFYVMSFLANLKGSKEGWLKSLSLLGLLIYQNFYPAPWQLMWMTHLESSKIEPGATKDAPI